MESGYLKQPLFQKACSYILNFNVDALEISFFLKKKKKSMHFYNTIEKFLACQKGMQASRSCSFFPSYGSLIGKVMEFVYRMCVLRVPAENPLS